MEHCPQHIFLEWCLSEQLMFHDSILTWNALHEPIILQNLAINHKKSLKIRRLSFLFQNLGKFPSNSLFSNWHTNPDYNYFNLWDCILFTRAQTHFRLKGWQKRRNASRSIKRRGGKLICFLSVKLHSVAR